MLTVLIFQNISYYVLSQILAIVIFRSVGNYIFLKTEKVIIDASYSSKMSAAEMFETPAILMFGHVSKYNCLMCQQL